MSQSEEPIPAPPDGTMFTVWIADTNVWNALPWNVQNALQTLIDNLQEIQRTEQAQPDPIKRVGGFCPGIGGTSGG